MESILEIIYHKSKTIFQKYKAPHLHPPPVIDVSPLHGYLVSVLIFLDIYSLSSLPGSNVAPFPLSLLTVKIAT